MSKTKEELNAIKEEVETLNKKLHVLTEEELEQVCGGQSLTQPGHVPGTKPATIKIVMGPDGKMITVVE